MSLLKLKSKKMKNILYFIVLIFAFAACSPDEHTMPANITSDQVSWEYVATDVLNEYELVNNTPGTSAYWDMGNGVKENGNTVTARYTFAGTYTIKVTIISQGGSVTVEDDIVIAQDNPAFLSGYPYDELTGGSSKTWAVDGYASAAFGLGPTLDNPLAWHADVAGARVGKGLYDDRFTFSIATTGLVFEQETNGDVYANSVWATDLGSTDGYQESDGNDFIMPYDGSTVQCIVTGDGFTVSGGFLGYYAGATEYKIITCTENLLEVAFWDSKSSFYWYTKFVPEDQLTPEPEPVVKQLEANDLYDDFEGNGNIAWVTSAIDGFTTIDNFAPVPINTSEHVALYHKGTGEWNNVSIVLDYLMDLSVRNVFTLKVFVPSFNDYVTECNPGTDWLATHNLLPQIDIKLQDSSLGGNAWQTQQVRSHTLTEDQFGQWVELTFDFSDVSDRTDFDQIVLQLGNEGHCNDGIFYVDDFKLLD